MTGTGGLPRALAALVADPVDVGDVLSRIVVDAAEETGAGAAALLARDGEGLTPLAATSHRVAELEALQAQEHDGPCVEAIRSGEVVNAFGIGLGARWPEVGSAVERAGFTHVEAYPVRWRGEVVGGLNFFGRALSDRAGGVLRHAYADLTGLAIVVTGPHPPDLARTRLAAALEGRRVVELAKGVLAEEEGVDLSEAYDLLLDRAREAGTPLTRTAEDVVRRSAGG